jgi:hypothetical protein
MGSVFMILFHTMSTLIFSLIAKTSKVLCLLFLQLVLIYYSNLI